MSKSDFSQFTHDQLNNRVDLLEDGLRTQRKRQYDIVDSGDADLFQCNDTSDCAPVVGVGNILIEKCSFLRNSFRLPPDVAFQVHCLSVISQHRGNDLNISQHQYL